MLQERACEFLKREITYSVAVCNLLNYLNGQGNLSDEFNIVIGPMLKDDCLAAKLLVAEPGNVCQTAYWIEKGYARFYMKCRDEEGVEIEETIDFCGPGKILVISECFFRDEPCQYYVEIAKDSVIVPFSRVNFEILKLTAPEAEALANNILSSINTERIWKMKILKMKPRQRYAEFLKAYGMEIMQYFKVKQVASYLNMCPKYLSRVRGGIKRRGDGL
jgi:CRP-like cAMP-binding protein